MRELLFRGQTRRKGQKVRMDGTPVESNWVYGGIFPGTGDYSVIYTYDPIDKFPVYTDTIGQFTGRVDKNGKKVFEGDILHVTVDGQDWGVGVVQWCDHDQCFSLFTFPDSNHRLIDFGDLGLPEYYEIIGNMYDDPHLLSAGGEINA